MASVLSERTGSLDMSVLEVKTTAGIVRGIPGWNQAIAVFRGIPYAKAPVGELRWKAPQPVEPWEGVRETYTFGNICYQERRASEGGDDIIGNEFYCLDWPRDEDCLYLNVWTPIRRKGKLPVCVYLHGGGFAQGYGHLNCYDGEGFAKRGCVMVSVNHRLGLFGYFAHPELTAEDAHHTSGNYGVLDIFAALQWVQENIEAFGGDPEHVTVFGQSGGGEKVMHCVISPLAKGMIHGAIMQSSFPINRCGGDTQTLAESEQKGVDVLKAMGYSSIDEARAASQEEIQEKFKHVSDTLGWDPLMGVGPNIDGYVFPEQMCTIAQRGDYPDLPIMLGCTADEFAMPVPELTDERIAADADRILGEGHREEFREALSIDTDPEKAKAMYATGFLMTGAMHAGAKAWCEASVKNGKKAPYQYYVTVVPPGAAAAQHSTEHHYVFQTLTKSSRPYTGRDYDLSNALAAYWANFVKTGDPNGEGLPVWEPYTAKKPEAMMLEYDLHMAPQPLSPVEKLMVKHNLEAMGE